MWLPALAWLFYKATVLQRSDANVGSQDAPQRSQGKQWGSLLEAGVSAVMRSSSSPGAAFESYAEEEKLDHVELPHLRDRQERMPWQAQSIAACGRHPGGSSDEARNLMAALKSFCDIGLGELAKFYTDPQFLSNDKKFRDEDGWVPEAYVSYISISDPQAHIGAELDLLLQSAHRFSSRPIVVANFGSIVPASWTPERYPNLLLVHAKPMEDDFPPNFNKIRAMMFTKVQTGIVVDADQFLSTGCDRIFARTREEITSQYPYPILPVHWMSRDPEGDCGYHVYDWHFVDERAPKRTMRWGHAHPTFTHYAYPFLAKWTLYAITPRKAKAPVWVRRQGHLEDEDMLNIALWSAGATKQWCKFDVPFPSDFSIFKEQGSNAHTYPDSKWFPHGIPLVFYSAHAAKDPQESYEWLQFLWGGDGGRKHIYYNGSWFESGQELHNYDPSLKCIV
mmetsp:Transcript_70669/g.132261  ORF Transcript_70669/g.132261 Transcript_70669/m.132261 type:complete len:450 (-) Transcript_70669:54-1403(-)